MAGRVDPDWTDMLEVLNTDADPEDYPESEEEWVVLYPEDYESYMKDDAGNLAVRVNARQLVELNRLAVEAFEELTGEIADA